MSFELKVGEEQVKKTFLTLQGYFIIFIRITLIRPFGSLKKNGGGALPYSNTKKQQNKCILLIEMCNHVSTYKRKNRIYNGMINTGTFELLMISESISSTNILYKELCL